MMTKLMIPISDQAISDMKEDDKLPYAPEGSFVRWYLDAMESIRKGKGDDE